MLIYANLRSPGRDPGVQSAFKFVLYIYFYYYYFFFFHVPSGSSNLYFSHSNLFIFSPFPGHQMFIFWPVENCTTWNLRYLMLRDAGWALRHWRSCLKVFMVRIHAREVCGYTMYSFLREWWWPWKGPTHARRFDKFALIVTHPEDDKYKLIETSSMSGPFSGPPSFSQERIPGVTANLVRINYYTVKPWVLKWHQSVLIIEDHTLRC